MRAATPAGAMILLSALAITTDIKTSAGDQLVKQKKEVQKIGEHLTP